MNALASTLLGLTVWFAGQTRRSSGRHRARARLGDPDERPTEGRAFRIPGWAPWAAAGGLAAWVVIAPWCLPLGVAAGVGARRAVRRRADAKREAVRDEQLADAVGSVSAALRAGLSVPQAIGYTAGETPPPLGNALGEVTRDIDLGVPMETAVGRWARVAGTDDARLFAGVLRLHRRSGGDLPSVLDQVAATLRERRAAVREVRSLTAQGRLSGAILGFLPIGFFAFLWLTSRSDIEGAFRSPAGLVAIGVGLSMEALAFVWIRHLLEVE
jgi:Flp pilus assembly protein TadB